MLHKLIKSINGKIDAAKMELASKLALWYLDENGVITYDYDNACLAVFGIKITIHKLEIYIPLYDYECAHNIMVVGEEEECNG